MPCYLFMELSMKKTSNWLLVAASLLLFVAIFSAAAIERRDVATSIGGSKAFYGETHSEPSRMDSAWLLNLAGKEDASFRAYLTPPDKTMKEDPFFRMFNHSVPNNITITKKRVRGNADAYSHNDSWYDVEVGGILHPVDLWDGLLLKALYCDRLGHGEEDLLLLTSIMDGQGGYADLHTLFGLLILEQNGCYDSKTLRASIGGIAGAVIAAQDRQGRVDDLYVERIALLYWSGYGDLVKRPWMRKVVKNQNTDGGWGDTGASNSHTTGLAVLSLLYYQEGKGKQEFYG